MPTMYALLNHSGTAAAETALCACHYPPTLSRAIDAEFFADPDLDITRWVDCSDNDALTCFACGATNFQ